MTNDGRRTTDDGRRKTNDERRTTDDGRRKTNDERRTTNDDEYTAKVLGTGAELVEAPPFDKLRGRAPTVFRYTQRRLVTDH